MIKNYKIINEPRLEEFLKWCKQNKIEHLRQDIKSRSYRLLNEVDFELLKRALKVSPYLRQLRSLQWMLNNYYKIICGNYAQYPTKYIMSLTPIEREEFANRKVKEKHYDNYDMAYKNLPEFAKNENRLHELEHLLAEAEFKKDKITLAKLESEKQGLLKIRPQILAELGLTEESCGLVSGVAV